MKVVLATSEVTYVPGNYISLFEELLGAAGSHVAAVFILNNLSAGLVKQLLGLAAIGCNGTAGTLGKNILGLPFRKRERLFERHSVPVFRAKSMNEDSVVSWVRENQVDLVLNLRTRCIYRKQILEAPRLGCVNVHHGLLPEYRGTLCDLYALHEGRPAGFTVHQMNEKVDDGRILIRHVVSRPGEKNYIDYLSRTGQEEGRVLSGFLNEVANTGTLPEGNLNTCAKPRYTKNPDRSRISQMRQAGMVL
ncbi:MAG: hypothetical protein A2X94_10955 [Bdellovibrionales bacterium GWB1_55_8]|nr:MAG: hypothetical protein A2X94_10955 [Bdellovibrionales bacterium GWB1_55_8]